MNQPVQAPEAGEPLIKPSTTDHPLYEAVVEACRSVYDPEIPVNIHELGLIYEVNIGDKGHVDIVMTLTAPGCPVAGPLADFVADKAAEQDEMNEGEANALREAVVAGAEVPATLAYVYALPDRIVLSGRSDGGPLGLGLGALLGMDGFLGIDGDMHPDFDHEGMFPHGETEEEVRAPISSDL